MGTKRERSRSRGGRKGAVVAAVPVIDRSPMRVDELCHRGVRAPEAVRGRPVSWVESLPQAK